MKPSKPITNGDPILTASVDLTPPSKSMSTMSSATNADPLVATPPLNTSGEASSNYHRYQDLSRAFENDRSRSGSVGFGYLHGGCGSNQRSQAKRQDTSTEISRTDGRPLVEGDDDMQIIDPTVDDLARGDGDEHRMDMDSAPGLTTELAPEVLDDGSSRSETDEREKKKPRTSK